MDHVPAQVLKFNLHEYNKDGAVHWVAARLYQGQMTHFQTLSGGFAPVCGNSVQQELFMWLLGGRVDITLFSAL